MMDYRQGIAGRPSGVVEVDEAVVGGKPKFRHGVKNKQGRVTGKPIALVAAARNGRARAGLIPNAPTLFSFVERKSRKPGECV